MAARSRGNGTNFDWLRKSCDISTCDLSPDGNPEKYGRPINSAIPITDKMDWGQHISETSSKATKTLGFLHAGILHLGVWFGLN